MKYLDPESINQFSGILLEADDRFSFRCHSGLSCFNQCCRNLNLFLYPYDVLRLKESLQIPSGQFLDHYVDVVLREGNFFPEVLLKMDQDEHRSCIFLSEQGCSIYESRPHTCRLYPMEQGFFFDSKTNQARLIHLFRPPAFCLGQYENQRLTPLDWMVDQNATVYSEMTSYWAGIKRLFQIDPWGSEGPAGPKAKMAFMAVYNIDRFRDFIFNSSFLKRYRIKSSIIDRIRKNDVELMKFGCSWIKLYLWGIQTTGINLR
ncbi:MAG: hypothetical protein A2V65_05605 [Deltaproteobacteria bacterium RBG_13_49_15]|nr:MAG: hypothetical protein A2V65_05605 [Deltaproteobacteria bacterium RBG_13_49_15]